MTESEKHATQAVISHCECRIDELAIKHKPKRKRKLWTVWDTLNPAFHFRQWKLKRRLKWYDDRIAERRRKHAAVADLINDKSRFIHQSMRGRS